MNHIINLASYKNDSLFYEEIHLLLTVKSFNLQGIRQRYLASKKNKSGKLGSSHRREKDTGGIVYVVLNKGKIIHSEILCHLIEPRGIDVSKNIWSVATDKNVFVFDKEQTYTLSNDWFSYIHTIHLSPYQPNQILIASSGLDCVFEVDYTNNTTTYAWHAWDHGFHTAQDPINNKGIILTRHQETAEKLQEQGKTVKLINNPKEQKLPTAQRAAFINSVWYDSHSPNHFLATFFHEGAIYSINRTTGKAEKVLDGLKNPHGGKNFEDKFLATSTGTGEVIIGKQENKVIYNFQNLSGKPSFLSDSEWLQNTSYHKDFFITIDSNRNAFFLFQPSNNILSKIDYDNNWAIQDLVVINDLKDFNYLALKLKNLENPTN